MALNEAHARIKSRVWQAVAQSDLDLSALDKDARESLVDLVTEAALLEMDTEMDRSLAEEGKQLRTTAGIPDTSVFDDEKEDILWQGRPFLSLTLHYTITDERIRITEGLLGKSRANIELVRIQDINYSQTFSERLLNLGDISIQSHDRSNPEVILKNVSDPEGVYEILRRAVLQARKKHNLTYREEM